jgi:TetR/AcrR family transcriptional repressor of nem operon
MSRKRLVSVNQALTRAIQQFQRYGYHASSIQNLEDCTGLARGSLYNTFDSKRGLFITALRYYATSHQQRLNSLLNQLSPRAAILRLFENTIYGPRDGCFLVNTSVELAPHDQEVAQIVAESFHEIEQSFFRLIDHGQAGSKILHSDPALAARGLLGLYIALCVLVRSGSDQATLRDITRLATALLTDLNPT